MLPTKGVAVGVTPPTSGQLARGTN